MNEVANGLWVSDIDTVAEETTARFDRVVSVCQDTVGENVGCPYSHFPLADDAISVHNWGGTTDYETFCEAASCVLGALVDGDTVLVHCHHGKNRSVAVTAAALAVHEQIAYEAAFLRVRDARPIANPQRLMRRHAKRYVADAKRLFEADEALRNA